MAQHSAKAIIRDVKKTQKAREHPPKAPKAPKSGRYK